METKDLFYPEMDVGVGAYSFTEGVELEAFSSQESYFDWAKIRFTKEFNEKIVLAKRDEALISLGYSGSLDEVFQGYVTKPYSGNSKDEIILKDTMLLLEETKITNTFLAAAPTEIVEYCLGQAGITKHKLFDPIYPARPMTPFSRKTVIEVFRDIGNIWKIRDRFHFSGDTFYWGQKPDQEKVYLLEEGVNIISLSRQGGVWQLETVSVPFIRHSHMIQVDHHLVSGTFEVKKVVFSTDKSGFIRTVITF